MDGFSQNDLDAMEHEERMAEMSLERWVMWVRNDHDIDLRDTIENRLDVIEIVHLFKVEEVEE